MWCNVKAWIKSKQSQKGPKFLFGRKEWGLAPCFFAGISNSWFSFIDSAGGFPKRGGKTLYPFLVLNVTSLICKVSSIPIQDEISASKKKSKGSHKIHLTEPAQSKRENIYTSYCASHTTGSEVQTIWEYPLLRRGQRKIHNSKRLPSSHGVLSLPKKQLLKEPLPFNNSSRKAVKEKLPHKQIFVERRGKTQ